MKIARRLSALAVVAAMLGVTACAGATTQDPPSTGGEVTMASVAAWRGFNPYQPDDATSTGIALARAIYPSAFQVTSEQAVKLNTALLESAEVISDDPQIVQYKINPDAIWSDDEPVGADDFVYLWKHLNGSNEALQVTGTAGYGKVTSVEEGEDAQTVRVTFSEPYTDWQSLFSPLLPAHYMQTLGDDTAAWNSGLATAPAPGAGPWQISENEPGQYIVLTPNPKWFGEAPKLDSLTLRVFGDDQAIIQGLSSAEADITFDVRPNVSTLAQLQAIQNVETQLEPTSNQQFLMTQMSRPISGDLDVRRAIATVLDPAAIARVLFGDDVDFLTNNHILAPTSAHYVDQKPAEFTNANAEAAAAILKEAGWTKGSDGIFAKDGDRLTLEWLVRSEDQLGTQVAQLAQAALKEAGIEIALKPVPSAEGFSALAGGEFDLSLGSYPSSDFPVTWYSALYTCDGGYNFARVCDEEVDRLFAAAGAELDVDKRAKLVNEIDARLWDSVSNIPMWVLPQMVSQNVRLEGVDTVLPKENQLLDAANWSITG